MAVLPPLDAGGFPKINKKNQKKSYIASKCLITQENAAILTQDLSGTIKSQHICSFLCLSDGKHTHIVAISSSFNAKISNNNITSLEFIILPLDLHFEL